MAKKSKQTRITGSGFDNPKAVPAIETKAEAYIEALDERITLTKKEVDARNELIALMRQHKRNIYYYDGRTIIIESKETLKIVTTRSDEGQAEDEK